MIIKKKNFALTPGFSGKEWPFSVAEVGISVFKVDEKNVAYVLLHDAVNYALSGKMESYGLPKLEGAGIWAAVMTPITTTENVSQPVRKSLSPFFRYLEFKKVGLG